VKKEKTTLEPKWPDLSMARCYSQTRRAVKADNVISSIYKSNTQPKRAGLVAGFGRIKTKLEIVTGIANGGMEPAEEW
jgi:hypothetical protein